MTRVTFVCVLGALFGAAGCGFHTHYVIPSQAIAPGFPSVPEATVAIEPELGGRRFDEIGVVTVGSQTEHKRDKLMRAVASEEGAHAVIDVKLVAKISWGGTKVYAATLIRWRRDSDTITGPP